MNREEFEEIRDRAVMKYPSWSDCRKLVPYAKLGFWVAQNFVMRDCFWTYCPACGAKGPEDMNSGWIGFPAYHSDECPLLEVANGLH